MRDIFRGEGTGPQDRDQTPVGGDRRRRTSRGLAWLAIAALAAGAWAETPAPDGDGARAVHPDPSSAGSRDPGLPAKARRPSAGNRSSVVNASIVAPGAGAGATYLTDTDNEDNSGTGAADGDMGGATPPCVFDTDLFHPIEFNVDVTGALPTTSATLLIEAFDIDETAGEIDQVLFNGVPLGPLTGANDVFSTTVFAVDVGDVVAGDNLVQIIVDEDPPGTNDVWCAAVASAQLVVDGGGPADATCRFIETDRSDYEFNDSVEVTVEVDTALGSQSVVVETNVLDAGTVNVAGASTNGTINGVADDPFQTNFTLPVSGTGGPSLAEALIFDESSGLFQDRCTAPIHIAPLCDTYENLKQPLPLSPSLGLARLSDEEDVLEVVGDTADSGAIAPLDGPLVRRLRWWGVSLEWDGLSILGQCLDDLATAFNFYFYADDGGAPGDLIASRLNVVPTEVVDSGFCCYSTDASAYRFDAVLDPPVASGDVRWIGIRREVGSSTPGGNACRFYWISETDQDLYDNALFWRDVADPAVNLATEADDNLFCVDASSVFLDGFESGNTSAWSSVAP